MSQNDIDPSQDAKASSLVNHLFGYKHAEDMILIAKELAAALERIDQLEVDLVSDNAEVENAALASLARLEECMASIKKLDQQAITSEITALSERVSAIGTRMEAARRELAESMVSRQELSATKDVSAERIVELRRDFESSLQSLKQEIASTAKEFAEPKSLIPSGEWKMGESYPKLAIVTLNGSSYVSTEDGNTEKPSGKSKKWQTLAKRGSGGAYNSSGELDSHMGDTAAHGATASNTASRIVSRNAEGTFASSGLQLDTAADPSTSIGLITWNDVDKTAEIATEGGVVLQIGQEETVYVRNNSGVALAEGDVVYITGASGQRTTVAKAQANTSLAQKTIGLVTTSGGIPDNSFGFVTLAGLVRDLNTNSYAEGTELWLSPTTAGGLTATMPTADTHRVVRVGYVVRQHANQGVIMVATHYHGTSLSNALMEAEGAAAGRTALGLGSLATQSGTFSGTSSGTNTGDQTISIGGDVTAAGGTGALTATVTKINGTSLAGLATGILKNTTSTGVPSIAVAGDFPTLNQNTTGTAANLSGTPALPNGTTATTQTALDNSTKLATTAYTDDAVKSAQVMLLEHDGYLQSDGATSNRAQIYGPFDATNNPREWIAGAASLTIAAVVTVPSGSADNYIVAIGSSTTTTYNGTANNMCVLFSSTGLYITQAGSSWSNNRNYNNSTFRTTYSGQTGLLKVYFVQGTTNPVVTWNGTDISSSFSLSTGGTPPAWLDASMVPTYRLVGYNWPSGPAPIMTPILGQTSAADDAFYMQTGKWPAWVVKGGSCQNEILSPTRNSNFSALATDFTAGGNCTVSAASGALVLTSTGSAGNQFAYLASSFIRSGGVRLGCRVRVVGNISSNTTGGTIAISDSSGNLMYDLVATTGSFDTTFDITGEYWAGGFFLLSKVQPASVVSFTCTSLIIYQLGSLSLPSVQPINVIDDVSGIGGNQGRLLGMTPVTNSTNWRISANTWTNGNQQILAGNVLDSTKDVIDQIEQSTSGTPTTTIGSASGGSQYKASGSLSAGINPVTLVTRKLASNDVWVNSDSTAVVRTTITGHRTTS